MKRRPTPPRRQPAQPGRASQPPAGGLPAKPAASASRDVSPATDAERAASAQRLIALAAQRIVEQDAGPAIEFLKTAAADPRGAAGLSLAELLGRLAQAIGQRRPGAALGVLDALLAIDPDRVGAWLLLASLCDRTGNQPRAREALLRAVRIPDAMPEQIIQASNLLVRLGEAELALDLSVKAYEQLGRPLRFANSLLYISLRMADWPTTDALIAQLRQAYATPGGESPNESPRTHLLWCGDEAINIRVVSEWSAQALPLPSPPPVAPMPEPLAGRRIRVGYLSSDYREHPTSRLINGLFRNHDRSAFEIFLYCSGWDDGSPMRREIESHVDHVHSVALLGEREAADLIRSHRIDVLVELNGPTRSNRMGILAHRPAPVQIDYLGWPGSVGGRVVDYVIGDLHTVPPGAELAYPEKVIRLREVYQINDYAARTLPPAPDRASFGLPADRPVLGVFNAINKVGSEVWRTWMRILQAAPSAVLWLFDPGAAARPHVMRAIREHGVDPRRIILAPALLQEPHLARLQCCDLMLDPWPYGGHTSTADALFAGVPVLAMDGSNFAGRVSGALLRAARLGALVQPDVASYLRVAVGLISQPGELARVRRFIQEKVRTTDVFDARGKTRQMETAYRIALKRRLAGLPPDHITFNPPRPRERGPEGVA